MAQLYIDSNTWWREKVKALESKNQKFYNNLALERHHVFKDPATRVLHERHKVAQLYIDSNTRWREKVKALESKNQIF